MSFGFCSCGKYNGSVPLNMSTKEMISNGTIYENSQFKKNVNRICKVISIFF